MEKNILIVNFNTNKLTQCCIKSINKTTPDCHIYVFDNSDKEPFENIFDNVEVIDNTQGHIINFEQELAKYDLLYDYGTELNNFASLKHTMTIDKFIDFVEGGFVLMDSDVLVKKDISGLFDENIAYAGQTGSYQGVPKLLPFICWLNPKEYGLRYFNERKCYGIRFNKKPVYYDTGASFLEAAKGLPHKDINYKDYILHYEAGSYVRGDAGRRISSQQWLKNNEDLWK